MEPVAAVPFEEFIEHLRRNGFVIGVDSYLRIQELLDRLGGSYGPADLKTLVCPLVARSEEEQEAFYAAFGRFYPEFEMQHGRRAPWSAPGAPARPAVPDAAPTKRRRVLAVLLVVAVVAMLGALFIWNKQRIAAPLPAALPATLPETTKEPAPQEPAPTPRPLAVPPTQTIPPTEATPAPPVTRFQALGGWRVALPSLALLVWLALELVFRRRRKLILTRRQGLRPPSMWPLRTESQRFSFRADTIFHSVSRRLQDRKPAPVERIDILRSVQATIQSLGFPVLVHQQATQIPEYIVLIDRSTRQDHQAQFFSELVESLGQEGILIRHYFFDDDPRECWSANGAARFSLSDLPSGSEHRLLLCTVGARLVDPLTGQLANWVELLERWPERAILTPVPVSEWGLVERKLASTTIVLPGNLRGIHVLVDYLEAEDRAGVLPARGMSAVPELSINESVEQQISHLRKCLGADVFTGLCACAVYPELHWDLTLEIAALPSMPAGLLSEENMLAMVRLPWFRIGYMPDELRAPLINELSRDQEREVRRCVLSLIASNPAPDNTLAHERQKRETDTSRDWLLAAKQAHTDTVNKVKSYVELTEANKRPSRANFVLPRKFRAVMRTAGMSMFPSVQATGRVATAALLGFLILSGIPNGLVPWSTLRSTRGTVLVTTTPPGAKIYLSGPFQPNLQFQPNLRPSWKHWKCATDCGELNLEPGEYAASAKLDGYDERHQVFSVGRGSNQVHIFMLANPRLKIVTDWATGHVTIDGSAPAEFRGGEFRLGEMSPGNHKVEVTTDGGRRTTFEFRAERGKAPVILGQSTSEDATLLLLSTSKRTAQLLAGKDQKLFIDSRRATANGYREDFEKLQGEFVSNVNGSLIQVQVRSAGSSQTVGVPIPDDLALTAFLVSKSAPSDSVTADLAIATTPPGAKLEVDGQDKCTTPCNLQLVIGNHHIIAHLDGYSPRSFDRRVIPKRAGHTFEPPDPQPTFDNGTIEAGRPLATERFSLNQQLQLLRIFSNIQADVQMDGKPWRVIQDGSCVNGVDNGTHSISVSGSGTDASFSFEVTPGKAPEIKGFPKANNLLLVLISSAGKYLRLQSISAPLKARFDGREQMPITNLGLVLPNVAEGEHELVVGEGKDQRKLRLSLTPTPSLTAYLLADVPRGNLMVVTNPAEDGATIYVNGRSQPYTTGRSGEFRVQLQSGQVKVRIAKAGFTDLPEQAVEVKKGEETKLEFKLKYAPGVATLKLTSAPNPPTWGTDAHVFSGASVMIDDQEIGKVNADGTFQYEIQAGVHKIRVRKRFTVQPLGTQAFAETRSFLAGETVEVQFASKERLDELAALSSKLNPAQQPGSVRILLSPPGARVTLQGSDGVERQGGITVSGVWASAVFDNVRPGRYTLNVKDSNTEREQNFIVYPGRTVNLEMNLTAGLATPQVWPPLSMTTPRMPPPLSAQTVDSQPEVEPELKFTSGPIAFQVLQRNARGTGSANFSGTASARFNQRFIEGRVISTDNAEVLPWTVISQVRSGKWSGTLENIPSGGPYRVEILISTPRERPSVFVSNMFVGPFIGKTKSVPPTRTGTIADFEVPWNKAMDTFTHEGSPIQFLMTPAIGTFRFKIRLLKAEDTSRTIRWALGYTDGRNYTQFELDQNGFHHVAIIDGKPFVGGARGLLTTVVFDIAIDVTVSRVSTRVNGVLVDQVLDAPNLSTGNFIFLVGARDEIEVSNFTFAPSKP